MNWNIALSVLTVFVVEVHTAGPVDACGVKLTVKSSSLRKAVARTTNPSDILLLGNPPRRMELDLLAAGHRVEVAATPAAAKRKSYAVVITDGKMQDDARTGFPGAVVIVRSSDLVADVRAVEQQVGRRPVRAEESRPVVAAAARPAPIAAGPQQPAGRRVVATGETQTSPATTPATPSVEAPTPAPTPVEQTVAKVTTTPPAERKPPREAPPAAAVASGAIRSEVYFAISSSRLTLYANRPLASVIRWLNDSKDARAVIEGHADPSGTPEGNFALAQKRAERVRDYLVAAGIDESRLEVVSYGDTRLRYARTDGRNRRVAVVAK
jgi:outer membrane protein OmpA-like peptidoglycan-associated protein